VSPETPQASTPPVPPRTGPYAWYVLGILLAAYVLNFVDRQILAIAATAVKEEMALTDFQLGLLLGPAFVTFYTLAGLPIARLADATSRKLVLTTGLALWSAMTAACGAAGGFLHLALARFGVGVGEAAGTPPSHAMISDLFPAERRATALAIYATGIYFGTGFGFAGGGYVLEFFDWRTAFFAAGLLGLPVVLLLAFTVREPRPAGEASGAARPETPPIREVVRVLFGRRAFVLLVLASCCQAFLGYAVLSWGATFYRRVFEMSYGDVGLTLGLLAAGTGALGATLGGRLADGLGARDARWYVWLSAIVSVAAFPFAAAFALAPTRELSFLAFAPFYLLNNMYVGPLWSLTQGLVHPRMRATASATLLALLNLVGYGIGPPLIGWINDALEPSQGVDAIRTSLLFAAVVGASASVFFVMAGKTLREDLARAEDGA